MMKHQTKRQKRGGGGYIRPYYIPDETIQTNIQDRAEFQPVEKVEIQNVLKLLKNYLPFSKFSDEYIVDCLFYHMKFDNFVNCSLQNLNSLKFGKFITEENRFQMWKELRTAFSVGDFNTYHIDVSNQYEVYSILETYLVVLLNSKVVNDLKSLQSILNDVGFDSINQAYECVTSTFKAVYESQPKLLIHKIVSVLKR